MSALQEDEVIKNVLTGGRVEQPDEPFVAPHRGSVTAQVEDLFYDNFMKYMKNAEARRRWNIHRDIPWATVTQTTSELTANIVESFCAVEMYLPDYTHKIMELVRRSRGRGWFQANWGYEESKHSMVLEEWLIRSGQRTEEQVRDFQNALLGAEWQLPFETPRQMIIYTMIQEMATGLNYTNLRQRGKDEGDPALVKTLSWVGADESAHYNFFRRGVKTYLELEPVETVADIKYVFEQFAMPAHALIPNWEERGREIEAAGIYGPKMYLGKIRRPILEDLGIGRQQLRDAGLPQPEADEIADRREEEALDATQIRRGIVRIIPSHPAPLAPAGRTVIATY